jgi:hypothetical protein
MQIDKYTKVVLTLIAVCLLWLSIGGPALLPTAHAESVPVQQQQAPRVTNNQLTFREVTNNVSRVTYFVTDTKTNTCWLASVNPGSTAISALASAPADVCK